jgi:hypothetical protein
MEENFKTTYRSFYTKYKLVLEADDQTNGLLSVHAEYLHSSLSYNRGYDFVGDGSSENSLESNIGIGGGFGDFKHHQYIPHHQVENGKHPNHKSLALKGLLVPLAGVALLGKTRTK